jgi:hypothetical protein
LGADGKSVTSRTICPGVSLPLSSVEIAVLICLAMSIIGDLGENLSLDARGLHYTPWR